MDDVIEGIDYIFDRYTYLGLNPDAPIDLIKTEIRKKRAENHPDKLLRVSEDIKNIAKRNIAHIDECERILTNDELRPLYNIKLQEFKDTYPNLVSVDGTPIVSIYKFKVHLSYLLNQPILDISHLKAMAATQAGYNEKKLTKARKQHINDPDEETREELRSQLTAKLVYFNVIEDYYWQQAGIHGATHPDEHTHAQSADDVKQLFDKKIEKIEHDIQDAVENRNGLMQLGFSKPLLLTNNSVEDVVEHDNKQIITAAVQSFTMRAEELKHIVQDKIDTLKELTSPAISRNKLIKEVDSQIYDIFLIKNPHAENDDDVSYLWPQDNIDLLGFAVRLDAAAQNVSMLNYDNEILHKDIIENYPHNIIIVDANPEVAAPLMETMEIVQHLVEQWQNKIQKKHKPS